MIILASLLLTTTVAQDAPPRRDSVPPVRITALPLVSYSDVTGVQYGGTVFLVFRAAPDSATRASTASFFAARTAKSHAKAIVQLDRWSPRNSGRFRARMEYISYPLPYYGVGASTPDSAEEWYSSGVTTVQLFRQRLLRAPIFLHGGLRYVHSRIRETEPEGVLTQLTVVGSAGSKILIPEVGLVVDSRDHPGAPRSGAFARIIPSIGVGGKDAAAYRRLTVDARRYSTLGGEGVLALQLQYDGVNGTAAPFDLLPMIGADTAMRGYPRGRYRDRQALTMQGEVRSPYRRRVGVVAFAGAGTVAHTFTKIASEQWYPTLGTGLRYLLSPREKIVLRADLALGRGSFGLSVGIGEAF